MNFGELKTHVQDVLGRTDIPEAAYVMFQDDVARRLKLQGDEVAVTLTSPYALPADFLSAVDVRHNGYRLDAAANLPDSPTGGAPDRYKISNGVILTWPVTTNDLALVYNQRPSALSNASDTNTVLDKYLNVAVYGALYHCCTLIRDAEGQASFGPMYVEAIRQAQEEDQRARYSGGAMIPTPREVA